MNERKIARIGFLPYFHLSLKYFITQVLCERENNHVNILIKDQHKKYNRLFALSVFVTEEKEMTTTEEEVMMRSAEFR